MEFRFTVRGDRITEYEDYTFIEGNKGYYNVVFDFGSDPEWESCAKMCIVEQGNDTYPTPIFGDRCLLPELVRGTAKIGVIGTVVIDGEDSVTISTNMCDIGVQAGAAGKETNAELNTAAQVWEKYLTDMETNRIEAETAKADAESAAETASGAAEAARKSAEESGESARLAEENKNTAVNAASAAVKAKEDAEDAKNAAGDAAEKTEKHEENAYTYYQGAKSAKDSAQNYFTNTRDAANRANASANNAAKSEENAKASEEAAAENKAATEQLTNRAETAAENAEESEVKSSASQKSAQQALADLLAMINSGDIVLATGGKLPLSAIPATATQEIYTVTNEDDLTSLVAQRGDLAELVEEIDGERTITKTWQCLGDASVRENWVVWGTSYAVQSGNSTTANNALNANTINNHRLVEMTDEEFTSAVKDADTYYLVY